MSPACILVADEDLDTRIILRTLLDRHGYAVIEAASAHAAMEVVQQTPVALVIMNYPMRVAEGLTLPAWFRQQPATRSVPIINLTSRAIPLLLEQAARDGVTISLAKPLDTQRLLQLVHELSNVLVVQ
jgi:sigma-B regulation protein RsbU (phosphoserine phosphatase)